MRYVKIPPKQDLMPAAEYVRMSTDTQEYSIDNQRLTIRKYAAEHGYSVVTTYSDPGKSGVILKGRLGLAALLNDVVSGTAQFRTILVYDVSRWGRFQDLDEAAQYEFLCKSHGIPVRYCAEQFSDDNSLPTLVMKTLKRTMAAEYSRELGTKVFAGMCNLAQRGFLVAGTPGLGLRRMMISPDGCKRMVLNDGEQKALKTYRTILVPGPKTETDVVQKIFSMALKRENSPKTIARYLNQRQIWPWPNDGNERRWNSETVLNLLKRPKYMGCYVYGKTTKRLHAPCKTKPANERIIVPTAFVPIIDAGVFQKVQSVLRARNRKIVKSNEFYLNYLRRVLQRNGQITEATVRYHGTFTKRFGSLLRAYDCIGYKPSAKVQHASASHAKVMALYANLFNRLKSVYPECLTIIILPGPTRRRVLEFDGWVRVAVQICSPVKTPTKSGPRWLLKAHPREAGYPSLICMPDQDLTTISSMHLVPEFSERIGSSKTLKVDDRWLEEGKRVSDLAHLREMATTMTREWQAHKSTISVGDVTLNTRTTTVRLGRKWITLRPIDAELFKCLVQHEGIVLSSQQLLHPFRHCEFPGQQLKDHIWEIRERLGPRLRQRIRTLIRRGYAYVSPDGARH